MSCKADYRIRAYANTKTFFSLCWLLGLMVWLFVLTQQGTLSPRILLGWMAHHAASSTENLTLCVSSPDTNSSTITGLPGEDCDLAPTPVIGGFALAHSCMWPTHFLERPQLLTRV